MDKLQSAISFRVLSAVASGISAHHLALRKGEWHLRSSVIIQAWLCGFVVIYGLEAFLGAREVVPSIANTLWFMFMFTVALLSSIATYRLFFHRLRRFPGPKLAALSKLWHCAKCIDSKNHVFLDGLKEQYGDFVRTGPNEITIFDPETLIKIDGPGSKAIKSDFYDFLWPDVGVALMRDKPFHDKRRKLWLQGTSAKNLVIYEDMIAQHADKLEKVIEDHATRQCIVPFREMAYWFGFDVMGMFMLSKSFDMITNKSNHGAFENFRRSMKIFGPFQVVPWLIQLLVHYFKGYWIVKSFESHGKWCSELMQERITTDNGGTDIASYLIADSIRNNSIDADRHLLTGEAVVAIVAGSDTTSPVVAMVFFELARHPEQQDKLARELELIDTTDRKVLENLPHLGAVINETLRLHPPQPTGGNRITPTEGMFIAGVFIPGNVTVVSPKYSIFRSEKCFVEPTKFVPERWTSKPELIKDSASFRPFGSGRYACVGKNIALAQLRIVTALLVSKYHFSFPPGFKTDITEAEAKDQFALAPGELPLLFTRRS